MSSQFLLRKIRHFLSLKNFHHCAKNANVFGNFTVEDNIFQKPQAVFLIQPLWKEDSDTTKTAKLQESFSLIKSIPGWKVAGHQLVEMRHNQVSELCNKKLFSHLTEDVCKKTPVTCIFISTKNIHNDHKIMYTNATGINHVFARNELVLFIFSLRAKSKAAKLHVSLATFPHLQQKVEADPFKYMAIKGCSGESIKERVSRVFRKKEQKLRKQLKDLMQERESHREVRNSNSVPTVAVVGYTNAGKTSLVKALSNSSRPEPKDELFSTLDVTAYRAMLPNKLNYVLIDTIGFLSDIPNNLLEAFSVIMEDMLQSDLLIHVRDMSHPDCRRQLKSVLAFLSELPMNDNLLHNIVEVRNKMDLTSERLSEVPFHENLKPKRDEFNFSKNKIIPSVICYTSVEKDLGIKTLQTQIEEQIMKLTRRQIVEVDIPAHGPHLQWLQNECTIQKFTTGANGQLRLTVIAMDWKIKKFLNLFCDVKLNNFVT